VLALGIAALEYRDRRASAGLAREADARLLVHVPIDELAAIEVADRGRLHRFERASTGLWLYHGVHTAATTTHTHVPDPVLSEQIERALAAFARTRIERRFPLGGDGSAYGLAAPELVILVYRAREGQPLAQYAVGHVAPDTASRYLAVVGSRSVVTIPGYQIDNLLALVQTAVATSDSTAVGAPR
jgi:hypothetical protein